MTKEIIGTKKTILNDFFEKRVHYYWFGFAYVFLLGVTYNVSYAWAINIHIFFLFDLYDHVKTIVLSAHFITLLTGIIYWFVMFGRNSWTSVEVVRDSLEGKSFLIDMFLTFIIVYLLLNARYYIMRDPHAVGIDLIYGLNFNDLYVLFGILAFVICWVFYKFTPDQWLISFKDHLKGRLSEKGILSDKMFYGILLFIPLLMNFNQAAQDVYEKNHMKELNYEMILVDLKNQDKISYKNKSYKIVRVLNTGVLMVSDDFSYQFRSTDGLRTINFQAIIDNRKDFVCCYM